MPDKIYDNILDAAERLFLKQGYSATSMRNIAKEAGYSAVSSIYNHFPDKEAIFIGLLEARSPYDEVFNTIQSIEVVASERIVEQLFTELTTLMDIHFNFFQLVMIDFLEFDAQHIRVILEGFQSNIVSLFTDLQAIESVSDNISPPILMRFVATQIFGYMMTKLIMPEGFLSIFSEEEWKHQLSALIINGIAKDES